MEGGKIARHDRAERPILTPPTAHDGGHRALLLENLGPLSQARASPSAGPGQRIASPAAGTGRAKSKDARPAPATARGGLRSRVAIATTSRRRPRHAPRHPQPGTLTLVPPARAGPLTGVGALHPWRYMQPWRVAGAADASRIRLHRSPSGAVAARGYPVVMGLAPYPSPWWGHTWGPGQRYRRGECMGRARPVPAAGVGWVGSTVGGGSPPPSGVVCFGFGSRAVELPG